MSTNPNTKVNTTITLQDLPEKAKTLSPEELNIFLARVVNKILKAKQVFVIETNKTCYTSLYKDAKETGHENIQVKPISTSRL